MSTYSENEARIAELEGRGDMPAECQHVERRRVARAPGDVEWTFAPCGAALVRADERATGFCGRCRDGCDR